MGLLSVLGGMASGINLTLGYHSYYGYKVSRLEIAFVAVSIVFSAISGFFIVKDLIRGKSWAIPARAQNRFRIEGKQLSITCPNCSEDILH